MLGLPNFELISKRVIGIIDCQHLLGNVLHVGLVLNNYLNCCIHISHNPFRQF